MMSKSQHFRPFIIPIFVPHRGCPHQCEFCNQRTITGTADSKPSLQAIRQQVFQTLQYRQAYHHPVQIAFYGGNFLGLDEADIQSLLVFSETFVASGKIHSVRFSTRPDTISPRKIQLMDRFSISVIELGAQSMHDSILNASRRGHTAHDTENAFRLLKQSGYQVGIQMMVGLPGDSHRLSIQSGRRIAALGPDFVRIYPTLVLNGSPLAHRYHSGLYTPMSLELSVAIVKDLYLLFKRKKIAVIRMGLQASEELNDPANVIAGPYHPAFGHLVLSKIFLDLAVRRLKKQKRDSDQLTIRVHPRSISRMRGLYNGNLGILAHKFGLQNVNVEGDPHIAEDTLELT